LQPSDGLGGVLVLEVLQDVGLLLDQELELEPGGVNLAEEGVQGGFQVLALISCPSQMIFEEC